MKTFKWPIITAVISSIGIFLYLLISKEPITTSSLSDTFFIVSLFFLIIGIALWIISSGFFDNFQRSMKNAFRFKKKNEPKEFIPLSVIGDAHRSFWLKTGGHLTDSVFRLSTILLGLRQDSKRTVAFYSMAKVLFCLLSIFCQVILKCMPICSHTLRQQDELRHL